MKNKFLLGVAIVASMFSCTTDDTSPIVINENVSGTTVAQDGTILLKGTQVEDLTLDATKKYQLTGALIMASGTTLTIPAGMKLEAKATGANVYIAIQQGAKINAVGTASNPIVLTSGSATPAAGDWGGLILLGKAPINTTTEIASSEIAALPYGGNDAADDSGIIKYLRVEYSGGAADGTSENNGISFYGIGSGTKVSYIQVANGKDDGIEFFGGTVNLDYVSIINAHDDSIDWTEGYTGTITNAFVKLSSDSDKAIEADGFNSESGKGAGKAYSNGKVTNLTVKGIGSAAGEEAIRLRVGTKATLTNVVLEGFGEGFEIKDTATGNHVVADDLNVNNVTFTDVTTKVKNSTGVTFTESAFISGDGSGTGTNYATWGASWTVQ